MKIGVLTYHRANNYGAYLQAYALTMKLKSLGYNAELIDFNMKCAEEQYKVHNKNPINWYYENIRRKMFLKEVKNMPLSKKRCVSDSIEVFEEFIGNEYDAIVAGSDEIWKLDSFRGFPNPYWLMDNGKYQRFSYAASSRSDFNKLNDQELKLVKKTIDEFSLVGVRDSYTYSELKRISQESNKIIKCCDPVYMYDFKPDKERGKEILKNSFGVDINKPLLGVMINDEMLAKTIANKLKKKFEIVSLFRQWPKYKKTAKLTPFEWVDVIAALDVLVSNYFHGVCFAILSNTYFVAVDSREKDIKKGKIYDLLNRNNYLDTFLSTMDENYIEKTINLCEKFEEKDYSKIVQNERQLGIDYFNKFVEVLS